MNKRMLGRSLLSGFGLLRWALMAPGLPFRARPQLCTRCELSASQVDHEPGSDNFHAKHGARSPLGWSLVRSPSWRAPAAPVETVRRSPLLPFLPALGSSRQLWLTDAQDHQGHKLEHQTRAIEHDIERHQSLKADSQA